jgi:hypothetical protein
MRSATGLAFGFAVLATMPLSKAYASSVAYPAGGYTRLAAERAVVLWDEAARQEHLVVASRFQGDARAFAYFVPTPKPATAKVASHAVGAAVFALVPSADRDDSDQKPETFGAQPALDVDAVTVTALDVRDGAGLEAWAKGRGFVVPPNTVDWASRYLSRGWSLSAVEARVAGDSSREVSLAPVVLSFASDVPLLPYAQPATDSKDEGEYLARHAIVGIDEPRLSAWVFAGTPVAAYAEEAIAAPWVHAVATVEGAALASAFGGESDLGRVARQRASWSVTFLDQRTGPRAAEGEVVLRPTAAEAAPGIVEAAPEVRAEAAPAPAPDRRIRGVVVLVAVLIVAAIAAASELLPGSRAQRS